MLVPTELGELRFAFLPGLARLLELHAAELPQKDDLCGAFCGSLALRLAGVVAVGGASLSQDLVALHAGTAISAGEHDSFPPGEEGRRDYVIELPRAPSPLSGTSAAGLVRAVAELAEGRLCVLPLVAEWERSSVEAVLEAARAAGEPCAVIANIATRFFWGTHPTLLQLLHYLEFGDADAGPPAEWDIGHFVLLLGSLLGRRGTCVLVADTYKSFGYNGVHLQPAERVAAALRRPGMTAGGLLLVIPPEQAERAEVALTESGISVGVWDNGSVDAATVGT